MEVYLDKNEVAVRLGVTPKTAAALMVEMNQFPISGTVRKRYRVTEKNLERWAESRMPQKQTITTVSKGSKKRIQRK